MDSVFIVINNMLQNISLHWGLTYLQIVKFLVIVFCFLIFFAFNLIQSVLLLIFLFIFVASIYVWLGVEFLGFSLVIIYVGAIAVLFLFMVMMLSIEEIELVEPVLFRLKQLFVFISFFMVFYTLFSSTFSVVSGYADFTMGLAPITGHAYEMYILKFEPMFEWLESLLFLDNITTIGSLLYGYYYLSFLSTGLALLVAMLAPIMLTSSASVDDGAQQLLKGLRFQDKYVQVSRDTLNTLYLH